MTWVVVKPVVLLCKKSLDWHIRREYQKKNWRLFAIKPSNAAHSSNHNLYTFLDLVERNLLCGCKPKKLMATAQRSSNFADFCEIFQNACLLAVRSQLKHEVGKEPPLLSVVLQLPFRSHNRNTLLYRWAPQISWKFRNELCGFGFLSISHLASNGTVLKKKCMKDSN